VKRAAIYIGISSRNWITTVHLLYLCYGDLLGGDMEIMAARAALELVGNCYMDTAVRGRSGRHADAGQRGFGVR